MKNKLGVFITAGVVVGLSLFLGTRGNTAPDSKSLESVKAESLEMKESREARKFLDSLQKQRTLLAKASVAAVTSEDLGPESPTLDYNGKGFKVANFPHRGHQKLVPNCKTCHHIAKPGETSSACRKCHDGDVHDKMPAIKDAYHARCQGCHKQTGKGPTGCNGCHGRK